MPLHILQLLALVYTKDYIFTKLENYFVAEGQFR
jgi:hypothetical protein